MMSASLVDNTVQKLKDNNVKHVFYLPCSKLITFIESFDKCGMTLIPVGKEEEAFGLAAGMHLSNKRSVILIQDAGLGNSLIPLISLLVSYNISVPVFIADDRNNDLDIKPKNVLSHAIMKIIYGLKADIDILSLEEFNASLSIFEKNKPTFVIL